MHVLRLKLITTKQQESVLDKSFRCICHIHNVVVKYAQKQIHKLWQDKNYINAVKLYNEKKKDHETAKDKELKKSLKAEIDQLKSVMYSAVLKYHLTEGELKKYAQVQGKKFSHIVTSQQVQKEVERVFEGAQKVLYSDGKNLHFKKLRDTHTISQLCPTNGVRFYDLDHTGYYPKKVNPKYEAEIEFLGEHIPVKIDRSDPYIVTSLVGQISYCELKRILFKDGYHYYVTLYIRSSEPFKYNAPIKEQGIDLGVSTVACVSDDNAILEELAPDANLYEEKIKSLQKKIDRSKRASNPENYNDDGTVKKGRHKWNFSKTCKNNMRKRSLLYRKKASYMEYAHYVLAKKTIANGCEIYTEKMEMEGLKKRSRKKAERQEKDSKIKQKDGTVKTVKKFKRKKRFGHSIANRAPAAFMSILKRKAEQCGGFVKEVDTKSFKASQYRHDTDTYEKVPLSQRSKIIDGQEVQRDLYSAFLLRNSNPKLTKPVRSQCIEKFPAFLRVTNNLIANMKSKNISMKQCFGF